MTPQEAIKWIRLDIEMAKFDPTTGEEAYLNEDARNVIEAQVMAIKALEVTELPSAHPEQRWIPLSERLPEEDDYKSCIECMDGAVWYFTENGTMGLGYYYESVKEWSTTNDLETDGKVVAWMPLPKPYREEGEKSDERKR